MEEISIQSRRVWIQVAKLFRKSGHFQPAYRAILHASNLEGATEVLLEKCKWLRDSNQLHRAISELNAFLNRGDLPLSESDGNLP
jgi:hypothetical protein